VAERLTAIFRSAPKGVPKAPPASPASEIAGRWDVTVQYEAGTAEHKLFLNTKGNKVNGTHVGWAFEGELKGAIDGDKVQLATVLPVGGQRLTYGFSGRVNGDQMSGDVDLGEYGNAKWTAKRHTSA
jgi:D-glucosaminate-6-phosphate ammonia-lyase